MPPREGEAQSSMREMEGWWESAVMAEATEKHAISNDMVAAVWKIG